MKADPANAASFRDPSGFLFTRDGILYRQVNSVYREDYDLLMSSGLYDELAKEQLLIGHEEADVAPAAPDEAYKVIKPEPVAFISYPYEWCFSQLKDAALTTLRIQKIALTRGMSLKDCSAYNVQFHRGRPVFIDTLSFEKHREGRPWVAYRQFCRHFLATLALMSCTDVRLGRLLRVHIDGVPLDLAAKLLPRRSKLRLALLMHIHMHAASEARHANDAQAPKVRKMGRLAMMGLIDSLEKAVRKLTWRPKGTEWAEYYTFTNYPAEALEEKKKLVWRFLADADPKSVWDLGANVGVFSRLASDRGIPTVAFDIDPAAVEKNYRQAAANGETNILPLLQDLTNPSPSIGWSCAERMSLLRRGPADCVLALALIHHLAISNNVPLDRIAEFLSELCRFLIIEFVPKSDSQVQKMLATRQDVFAGYRRDRFEAVFGDHFSIESSAPIGRTDRTLYLMKIK